MGIQKPHRKGWEAVRGQGDAQHCVLVRVIAFLQDMEPSIWATVLAVTWLNRKGKCYQDLCELLEAKAVTWLCSQAGES